MTEPLFHQPWMSLEQTTNHDFEPIAVLTLAVNNAMYKGVISLADLSRPANALPPDKLAEVLRQLADKVEQTGLSKQLTPKSSAA